MDIRDKFALDLAVELAMESLDLPRNQPSLKAAVKKKLLKAMADEPFLRDRYGLSPAAKKGKRRACKTGGK